MNTTVPRLIVSALAFCTAGCAAQIETRTGAEGVALASKVPVMVVALPLGMDGHSSSAQAAVTHALVKQGHAISDDSGVHLEVAISERSAPVQVSSLAGADISASRKRPFLRFCAYRIHRLTIAAYSIKQPGVTRVWAEEKHCRAELNDTIPLLAEQAVALLVKPERAGSTKRMGKN